MEVCDRMPLDVPYRNEDVNDGKQINKALNP